MSNLVHVCNTYKADTYPDQVRNQRAAKSWEGLFDRTVYQESYSRSFGDRKLPFIKDIVCSSMAESGELVVLTNADSIICSDFRGLVKGISLGWSRRRMIYADVPGPFDSAALTKLGMSDTGVDLFVMGVDWIKDVFIPYYPDLLISIDGWDRVLRCMLAWSGGVEFGPAILHRYHGTPRWYSDGRTPEKKYQERMILDWVDALGVNQRSYALLDWPLIGGYKRN